MKKDKENHNGKLQITRKDRSRESGERGGRNQWLLRMWAIGTHVLTATRTEHEEEYGHQRQKGNFQFDGRRSLFPFELTDNNEWPIPLARVVKCVG